MRTLGALILVIVGSRWGIASTIFDEDLIASFQVPLPPGTDPGIPVRPAPNQGGVLHFDPMTMQLVSGSLLFSTGDGTLTITVQDLGPLMCNAPQCAMGLLFGGNDYETILDGKSLGFTPELSPQKNPTIALGFYQTLPIGTFDVPIDGGQHTLDFEDLTMGWYGAAVNWPGGGGRVPAFDGTAAFHIIVDYTAPEPGAALLVFSGIAMVVLRRSMASWRSNAARFRTKVMFRSE